MSNPKFYPNSLPAAATTTAESAVEVLEGNVRSMALAQQANRRKAALFSCRQENEHCLHFAHRPIPFDAVGVNPSPDVVVGTIALTFGGQDGYNGSVAGFPYRPWNCRIVERFLFAGEYTQRSGTMLSEGRELNTCVSSPAATYSVNGFQEQGWTVRDTIDRTRLVDENTQRIGSQLAHKTASAAGCGNKLSGWVFGGFTAPWLRTSGAEFIQRLDYATENTSTPGSFAGTRLFWSAAGNHESIVLMGGRETFQSAAIPEILLFNIATQSLSTASASLSGIGDGFLGASVGNYQHVYRLGGVHSRNFYSADNDQVIRYAFATDSVMDLGIDMVKDFWYAGGWQSSRHGFTFGGRHSDPGEHGHWPHGSEFVQKVKDMSGAEVTLLLGENLKASRQEVACGGDFAAGIH